MLFSNRAAHRVARVGKLDHRKVFFKDALPQDHLAPHAAREGPGKLFLHVLELDRIVGDNFAHQTIPTRDRILQPSFLVLDLEADPVELFLNQKKRPCLLGPQVQAVLGDFLQGSHGDLVLLDREPRHGEIHLPPRFFGRRRPDLGKDLVFRVELAELILKGIELGVGDLRGAVVVEIAMTASNR